MARRYHGTRRETICSRIFNGNVTHLAAFALQYCEDDPAHNNHALPNNGAQVFMSVVGTHQGRTTYWNECLEAILDNIEHLDITDDMHQQVCEYLGRPYHPNHPEA